MKNPQSLSTRQYFDQGGTFFDEMDQLHLLVIFSCLAQKIDKKFALLKLEKTANIYF